MRWRTITHAPKTEGQQVLLSDGKTVALGVYRNDRFLLSNPFSKLENPQWWFPITLPKEK